MLLNQLCYKLWLYHNFFRPAMRLTEKTTDASSHCIKRVYGTSLPPFDRLCQAGVLSPEKEQRLRSLRNATNPCSLCQEIHTLINQLFAQPNAPDGISEDVQETLGLWKSGQYFSVHVSTDPTTSTPKEADH
jgi:hypothetical protein